MDMNQHLEVKQNILQAMEQMVAELKTMNEHIRNFKNQLITLYGRKEEEGE